MFDSVIQVCAERMRVDDVDPARARLSRFFDARYPSQSYELELPVPEGPITRDTLAGLAQKFHEVHEHIYGHAQRHQRVMCVAVRAVLSFRLAEPHFSGVVGSGSLDDARHGERSALFDLDVGYRPTPVFERIKLPPDALVVGPAILEQADTTTLVYPGQAAKADRHGNLVIAVQGSRS
jgi:N-methylhydantoinase A/oxoprolinase/acetone carboxylase beta subunit